MGRWWGAQVDGAHIDREPLRVTERQPDRLRVREELEARFARED
jgi:hypothetical protein